MQRGMAARSAGAMLLRRSPVKVGLTTTLLLAITLQRSKMQELAFKASIPFRPTLPARCEDSLPYLGCSIRSLNDQPGMEIMLVNS